MIDTTDDIVQPLSRAVTTKIETQRHAAQPDEQTMQLEPRPTQRMPRAELIRLMTQSYAAQRGRC